MPFYDDRVWTVRFRGEIAEWLRQHAAEQGHTVQQVIVAAVTAAMHARVEADEKATDAAPAEQDIYQYGNAATTGN